MKPSEKIIEEIADYLDSGLICYLHLKTHEIEVILDFDSWESGDEEPWQEIIDKIDNNWNDYFEFSRMSSDESFHIMEDFAETVDSEIMRKKLFRALGSNKPFRHFKWEIESSDWFRDKWHEFKSKRYIEFVKKQIEEYNRGLT